MSTRPLKSSRPSRLAEQPIPAVMREQRALLPEGSPRNTELDTLPTSPPVNGGGGRGSLCSSPFPMNQGTRSTGHPFSTNNDSPKSNLPPGAPRPRLAELPMLEDSYAKLNQVLAPNQGLVYDVLKDVQTVTYTTRSMGWWKNPATSPAVSSMIISCPDAFEDHSVVVLPRSRWSDTVTVLDVLCAIHDRAIKGASNLQPNLLFKEAYHQDGDHVRPVGPARRQVIIAPANLATRRSDPCGGADRVRAASGSRVEEYGGRPWASGENRCWMWEGLVPHEVEVGVWVLKLAL